MRTILQDARRKDVRRSSQPGCKCQLVQSQIFSRRTRGCEQVKAQPHDGRRCRSGTRDDLKLCWSTGTHAPIETLSIIVTFDPFAATNLEASPQHEFTVGSPLWPISLQGCTAGTWVPGTVAEQVRRPATVCGT